MLYNQYYFIYIIEQKTAVMKMIGEKESVLQKEADDLRAQYNCEGIAGNLQQK